MNIATARNYYVNKQSKTVVTEANSHQLVTLVLKKLRTDLQISVDASHTQKRTKARVSAISAINVLQISLDFENGGEISQNLFKIYEYIKQTLSQNAQDNKKIEVCCDLLSDIIEAWEQIG